MHSVHTSYFYAGVETYLFFRTVYICFNSRVIRYVSSNEGWEQNYQFVLHFQECGLYLLLL